MAITASVKTGAKKIPPKKRKAGVLFKEYHQLYLILIPAVIYFLLLHYLPMYGITMAFRDYKFNKGMLFSPWVGFRYFEAFFNYFSFGTLIKNTLVISAFKLIAFFPLPIIFALMINEVQQKRLKRVFQTISYLPHFISWVVAVIIFQQFLSLDGFINQIRTSMGLEKIFFMNESDYFYPIMFLSHAWKSLGFSAIIYLAALAGIDVSLYEAAIVDGAGKFRQMWHISIPSIMPTAIMLFILSLGSILNAGWEQIYLLRTPGNMDISDILDTYVIQQGLRGGQFGYASAVSLFQSVIGLVFIFITNRVVKKISASEIDLF